jgi:opacity protein-like surface antigen
MHKLVLTLLTILVFTSAALSQSENKIDLYLGSGASIPSGPNEFSDNWKMGYNIGGGIGYSLTNSVSIILSAEYSSMQLDNANMLRSFDIPYGASASIEGGTASCLAIAGNLKFLLPKTLVSVTPYVIAGLGYFNLSFSDINCKASYTEYSYSYSYSYSYTVTLTTDSRSAFSTSIGAGMDIPAGETMVVFLEARYFIAFTESDNTNIVPIRAGIKVGL